MFDFCVLNKHIRGRFKQTPGRKNIFQMNWNYKKRFHSIFSGPILDTSEYLKLGKWLKNI